MTQAQLFQQMQAYLEENLPHFLDLLRQMVEINSFTTNAAGVNALGQMTADAFAALGFTAETVPSTTPDYGRHLVLTRPGQSGRKIGMISHLDTVFPPQEEIDNDFKWRRRGNRIYGPGTMDIKGGTVIMYMMLAALQKFVPEVYEDITWLLLLDASEEADADDFGRLCRQRLPGSETLAALIFEAGSMNGRNFWVVRARKGMAVLKVAVEGKAAHSGTRHQNGANAIVQLARVVQCLADITDYDQDVTVNVGVVAGGTVTNRVPHYAQALVEMRAFDGDLYDITLDAILALQEQVGVESGNGNYTCQTHVEIVRKTGPWPGNEATDRLLAIWQEAAESLGYAVVPEERGGLSDGNHFWHQVPTLDGLGVAGNNAHCSEHSPDGDKDQEYCLVPSFVPKTLINLAAVLKLVG